MFYFIIKLNIFNKPKEISVFSFNNKYSVNVFYSIILDIRTAGISIMKKL
jgi:hypothetical protein